MPGTLFLDWRPHNRRAACLAEDLGATLRLAPPVLRTKALAPLRYLVLASRTLAILLESRPDVVIASSPPSFCPILAFVYARVFGRNYVVDAHHLATTGLWSRIPFGFRFNRFIMREALVTLVHNGRIETMVRAEGIPAITLETRIPNLRARPPQVSSGGGFSILAPCSFDSDEPIAEIFEAARSLPDVTFHMTGNPARLDGRLRAAVPPNVILTGFLSQDRYDELLSTCGAVLAMTTAAYPVRPRAASEAIAAERPLIASRNPATESHLGEAAILIENTTPELVKAIQEIRSNFERYERAIREIKEVRRRRYEAELQDLKAILQAAPGGSQATSR